MRLTGILPINKALDLRSTHCVEIVRGKLGRKTRVGHGGTLDSTASGLLVVLIGGATRLSNFVMEMPKCYDTVVCFGSETTTDDASGDVISEKDSSFLTEELIDSALTSFMGWRMQRPPRVSAVHVDGTRAHKLARGGGEVEIAAKPVCFTSVERTSPLTDGRAAFRVRCHKGTYIRSFARDLGALLGCGAHVSELRRVSVGPFEADKCRASGEIEAMDPTSLAAEILPLESLLPARASYEADGENKTRLLNGLSARLCDFRRSSFGQCVSNYDSAAVFARGLFSVCELSLYRNTLALKPSVNITDERGN